jgi:NADPH:quinone reductase-like Zn-dependent oxidoreductase
VRGFKPGDKVAALMTFGAFAQEVAADVQNMVSLPAGLSPQQVD